VRAAPVAVFDMTVTDSNEHAPSSDPQLRPINPNVAESEICWVDSPAGIPAPLGDDARNEWTTGATTAVAVGRALRRPAHLNRVMTTRKGVTEQAAVAVSDGGCRTLCLPTIRSRLASSRPPRNANSRPSWGFSPS